MTSNCSSYRMFTDPNDLGRTAQWNNDSVTITARETYRYLRNIPEFPEYTALAKDLLENQLASQSENPSLQELKGLSLESGINKMIDDLQQSKVITSALELSASLIDRSSAKWSLESLPLLAVGRSWLGSFSHSSTSTSQPGAVLAKVYFDYVDQAYEIAITNTLAEANNALDERYPLTYPGVLGNGFSRLPSISNSSFELPLMLMSLAQFPRTYFAELLGATLASSLLSIESILFNRTDANQNSQTSLDICEGVNAKVSAAVIVTESLFHWAVRPRSFGSVNIR